jgi:lysophospholipase L1-like esterase
VVLIITAIVHDSNKVVIKVRIDDVNREASEIAEILIAGSDTAVVKLGSQQYDVVPEQMRTGRCWLKTVPGTPDGAQLDNLPAAPITMAVFGDSIAWGLGLKKEHKASQLLADKISGWNHPVTVRVLNLANAGGVIGTDATKFPRHKTELDAADENKTGEVSNTNISVFTQLAGFANLQPPVPPESIDFVYLCAGANDVQLGNILVFRDNVRHIRALVDEMMDAPLAALIEAMLATFPNARILVAGYYPIITKQSNPQNLAELLLALYYLTRSRAHSDSPFGGLRKQNMVDNCQAFADRSNEVIGNVTDAANAARPNRERVFFAPLDFSPGHALFAPGRTTRLWKLNYRGKTTDEMVEDRTSLCKGAYKGNKHPHVDAQLCDHASVGHPDKKGAELYCAALSKAF